MEGLGSRSRYKSITNTQTLIISLVRSLSNSLIIDYILYLNNLFFNIPLAKILGEIDIGIMGTI